MFANPLWSVAILVALVAVYLAIIRPRLKVAFSQTYLHVDGWWERQWARIYAFRTAILVGLGPLLTALPDILVQLLPGADFSFLPQPWAGWANGASTVAVLVMKAYEVKPDGQQA